MRDGEFIINGIHSTELNAILNKVPLFPAPKRKSRVVPISGRDGNLFFDEEAYEDIPGEINLYVPATTNEEANYYRGKIINAFESPGYISFTHYGDFTKEYQIHLEDILFSEDSPIGYEREYKIILSVFPYKMERNTSGIISSTRPLQISNPFYFTSKPLIKIEGSGDVTLVVNEKPFVIKNIKEYIYIDSVVENSYREQADSLINENDKIFTLDYPLFKKGTNTISWTGAVTRIEIEPRWRTLT